MSDETAKLLTVPDGMMVRMTRPRDVAAVDVWVNGAAPEVASYRNMAFDVTATDADGYAALDTRDLPRDLTAWELAQILNMVIRAPLYVVRRDFAAVAHMFTPDPAA